MLLERQGPDEYFDHMSLKVHSASDITAIQQAQAASFTKKDSQWIVEELVAPLLSVGAVPFDYKFYCFGGEVGLIVQIDRNTGPTKVALFDGNFRPLKRGTDYLLTTGTRAGVPIVPLHAPEMLWWAQKLSMGRHSPFVRVDMLDSPTAPVFGEFTYSPGGTYKRNYVFSHKMIDRFDFLFTKSGPSSEPLASTSLELRKSLNDPAPEHYNAWASYAYNGGGKGSGTASRVL